MANEFQEVVRESVAWKIFRVGVLVTFGYLLTHGSLSDFRVDLAWVLFVALVIFFSVTIFWKVTISVSGQTLVAHGPRNNYQIPIADIKDVAECFFLKMRPKSYAIPRNPAQHPQIKQFRLPEPYFFPSMNGIIILLKDGKKVAIATRRGSELSRVLLSTSASGLQPAAPAASGTSQK